MYPFAPSPNGSQFDTFTFDNEGNLTRKDNIADGKVWLYTYDTDNHLLKAEHKPSSSGSVDLRVEFGYDVIGNRISKTVDADGDGSGSATTTKFAYDAFGNAWVDFTGTNTVVGRHIFGAGQDALIAKIVSGTTNWYGQDILGSTRDLFGATGSLIDHLDYSVFGKLTYESASGSDRYLWTSREYDAEIDLQYNRARYYDQNTGRWISQDPMGFDAGDSNLYRYVNNGPTGATDPSGLQEPAFNFDGRGIGRLIDWLLPAGPALLTNGAKRLGNHNMKIKVLSWANDFVAVHGRIPTTARTGGVRE